MLEPVFNLNFKLRYSKAIALYEFSQAILTPEIEMEDF